MSDLPGVKRFTTTSGVRVYRIAFRYLQDLSGRVHLVLGAGPPTLIDAGCGTPAAMADLEAGFRAVARDFGEAVRPADLRRILVTHAHADHVGGLAEWRRPTGAQIGVHPLDTREVVAPHERIVLARRSFRAFLRRAGVALEQRAALLETFNRTKRIYPPVPVELALEEGVCLDGIRIHHTPGHSPGHICLQLDDVLFVGDHILARTITQLWPDSGQGYGGMGHYLESLAKLERMGPVSVALGGHEAPIHDLPQRIGIVRGSHLRRLDRVLDILRKAPHPLSVAEIAEQTYAGQTGLYGLLALTDVAARIEYLDQQGRLAVANLEEIEREEQPVFRYAVAEP